MIRPNSTEKTCRMKLKDLYSSTKPVISFEIFPPRSSEEQAESKISELMEELKILAKHNPSFISVTYGAGGSTQDRTFNIVLRVKEELGITPLPHFTCVGYGKQKILDHIRKINEAGISNILALRGDPPKGQDTFIKPEDGFGYASELVSFIKSNFDMGIAVAGYPETHQEALSPQSDITNLAHKVSCGGDTVITQVFYDNSIYFDFVEKAKKAGVTAPIVPGILPVTSLPQIEKIVSMCSCSLPKKLTDRLYDKADDAEAVKEIGIEYAIEQCRELLQARVPGIHFYTLNKAYATDRVLKALI